MKMDNLRRYIDLRDSLVREKATLEQRLEEINQALGHVSGGNSGSIQTPSKGAAETKNSKAAKSTGRRGRVPRGGISLRDAVVQVLSDGPKTKQEILQGVEGLGYRFSTNNPMNSLGVILYGKNPRFKNENGQFGLKDGASSGTKQRDGSRFEAGTGGAFARKKRQLNPEARERIAAAQRERWAKQKAGK